MDPVSILREYIGIRTDHPNPDYGAAISYLEKVSKSMGFESQRVELIDDKIALLVYYRGEDSSKPAILLNSHIDVVKVDNDHWAHDPWAGEICDGKMYGRGTQDMKSLGIQQLFACYRLKGVGFVPQRDVVVCFVPEEEVMGLKGMHLLVNHLPSILFAMDEGLPSPNNTVTIYNGERKTWWLNIKCNGKAGHGSKYLKDGEHAVRNLQKILSKFMTIADHEKDKFYSEGEELAEIVTINPNYLSAGTDQFYNVIPTEAELGLDIRIPPRVDLKEFYSEIEEWCEELNCTMSLVRGTDVNCFSNPISTDEKAISALTQSLESRGIYSEVKIFPASTDARYLRTAGIPTFGMSVIRNCEVLLHDHNEYIPIKSFLEGIDVYEEMLRRDI